MLELVGGSIPAGRHDRGRRRRPPPGAPRSCAWMPQSDMLLPWKDAADNAADRPAPCRGRPRRGPRRSPRRSSTASASRGSPAPIRASCRAGCDSGWHSPDAARRNAGAAPRRAVRGARRDHPGRAAGAAAGRSRPSRGRTARHPRRRGGALHGRPGRDPLAAPGADRGEIESPAIADAAPSATGDHRAGVRCRPRAGPEALREPRHERPGRRPARLWPTALLVVALLGAWQLAASTGSLADALGLDSFLVPSPGEIGGRCGTTAPCSPTTPG